MAKVSRRSRFGRQPQEAPSVAITICKGLLVGFIVSLICTIFLSIISLVSDNTYIDMYIQYIMVAVTMVSIFIGSVYATRRIQAKGLIIGATIGFIYILFSVAIGVKVTQESLTMLMLANKFFAGIAAGALGGMVGVNL